MTRRGGAEALRENGVAMLVFRSCAVVLLAAGLGAGSASAQTTALFLDSQPGDTLGGGVTDAYATHRLA